MPITLHLLRSFLSRLTTMYLFSLARLTTSSSLIPGLTFVVVQPRSLRYSSNPNNCSSRRTVGRCKSLALRFVGFHGRFLRSFLSLHLWGQSLLFLEVSTAFPALETVLRDVLEWHAAEWACIRNRQFFFRTSKQFRLESGCC